MHQERDQEERFVDLRSDVQDRKETEKTDEIESAENRMDVRGEGKENALIKKREAERWINTLFDLCKRVAWVQGERTVWL